MNVQITKIEEKLELLSYLNPRTFDSVIEGLDERLCDLELKVGSAAIHSPKSSTDMLKAFSLTLPTGSTAAVCSHESNSKIGEEVAKLKKIVKGLNEELKSGLRPLIDQMFIDITNLNSTKGQMMKET